MKQINDILKSMQPPDEDGTPIPQPIAQLTRGLLNGTLQLARADQPTTTVKGNFTVDVAMTTHKEPLADIAITLGATAPTIPGGHASRRERYASGTWRMWSPCPQKAATDIFQRSAEPAFARLTIVRPEA
jgi:hypothetical protein